MSARQFPNCVEQLWLDHHYQDRDESCMAPVDLLMNLIIYCLHKQSRGISLAEHGRFASEFGR